MLQLAKTRAGWLVATGAALLPAANVRAPFNLFYWYRLKNLS